MHDYYFIWSLYQGYDHSTYYWIGGWQNPTYY